MSADIAMIQESFHRIIPRGEQFVADFYHHLLDSHPKIRVHFRAVSLEDQGYKLLMTLTLLVDNLHRPAYTTEILHRLGSIHADRAIRREFYPAVGDSLLACLSRWLGDSWTPALHQAWMRVYQEVTDLMLAGH